MGAGGDFGNDTTVSGMDVDLGNNDIRQNMDAVLNNGGGSLVARALNSQNFHCDYYNIFGAGWRGGAGGVIIHERNVI